MQVFNVRVKTNSPETKIISQAENEITLAVAAPPEQNKANIEMIKFLSRHFRADVQIIRGLKSKNKVVRLF